MATNDFVPFGTGTGANVESQADYLVDPMRSAGNQRGVAISALTNKAIRQSSQPTAALSQFIMDTLGENVVDNGNIAAYEDQLIRALHAFINSVITCTVIKICIDAPYIKGIIDCNYIYSCVTPTYVKGIIDSTYIEGIITCDYIQDCVNATYIEGIITCDYINSCVTIPPALTCPEIQACVDATYIEGIIDCTYVQGCMPCSYIQDVCVDQTYIRANVDCDYIKSCIPCSYIQDVCIDQAYIRSKVDCNYIRSCMNTLSTSITYYVSTGGNDGSDGSSGAPWQTLTHAASVISTINTAGNTIIVVVEPGTYPNTGFNLPSIFGGGSVQLLGQTGAPGDVLLDGSGDGPVISLNGSGSLFINGVTIRHNAGGSPPSRNGISSVSGANVSFNAVNFFYCSDNHLHCESGGVFSQQFGGKGWFIWDSAGGSHLSLQAGGNMNVQNTSTTIVNSVSFPGGFVNVNGPGALAASGSTGYSGAGNVHSTQRYSAQFGGLIQTNGGGPNFFPGDSAGDSSTGYYT